MILCLKDDGSETIFEFIPAIKGYSYTLSKELQVTRNSHFDYYKDKDHCLMDLLLYINSVSKEDKINNKNLFKNI